MTLLLFVGKWIGVGKAGNGVMIILITIDAYYTPVAQDVCAVQVRICWRENDAVAYLVYILLLSGSFRSMVLFPAESWRLGVNLPCVSFAPVPVFVHRVQVNL